MREKEHRSVYVQLKDLLKVAAAHLTVVERTEPLTCRVMINMGLECIVAGDEMHKGGKNEHVLRAAMRIINGEILRHGPLGLEVEGAVREPPHANDVIGDTTQDATKRNLNPSFN